MHDCQMEANGKHNIDKSGSIGPLELSSAMP